MSGGHFDYVQYKIGQAADEVEQEILNNSVKTSGDTPMTIRKKLWQSLRNVKRHFKKPMEKIRHTFLLT